MEKNIKFILKQISYREILSILLIIVGIYFAIDCSDVTLKIISVFVAFFGLVSLINIIAQKITYSVKHDRFKIKSATQLKTTVISDVQAKRTTIDNFEVSQSDDNAMLDFIGADEGFVIVNKSANIKQSETITTNETQQKQQKIFAIDFEIKEKDIHKKVNEEPEIIIDINKEEEKSSNIIAEKIVKESENIQVKILEAEDNQEEEKIVDEEATEEKKIIDEEKIEEEKVEQKEIVEEEKEYLEKLEFKNNDILDDDTSEKENIEDVLQNVKLQKEDEEETQKEQSKLEIPRSLIVDDKEFNNPMEEFGFLVSRFLVIIRSVIEANTVAFVWVNYENQSLLFDVYMNSPKVKDKIRKNTKIPFGNDILSQIVQNAKPEILTNINPIAELDLIPYYSENVNTASFIGIPILFENKVVGILCADTDKVEAYEESTVAFLGQFTRLLSTLFSSYTKKFVTQNATKILEAINNLTKIITEKDYSFSNVCAALLELIAEMYECSSVGICIYNEQTKEWQVSNYKSTEEVVDDLFFSTPIVLDRSLVGISIADCRNIFIAQLPDEYTRVNNYEPLIENGSFISIPIKSVTNIYGALFLEARASSILNAVEFEVLEALCNHIGEIYEKINMVRLFNENVSIDRQTGILNNKALKNRIQEELVRNQEVEQKLSLVLISLDKYSAFNDINKKNKIINYLIKEIRKHLKKYEIIGRINEDVIGILNINQDAEQVKHYVEKVRHQIATKFVEINGHKIVLTISAGIVTAVKSDTFESFTTNATIALHKAQERGGNALQIYQ
ncbi:MAG: GGDEF domain-containing protein [Ignavibacteria bacterium]|jgi:diguanylate cyclase (GGDEF)-like protein|nr:GGDEF domain-containing protein [Ignavibacteria bacterium]